MILRLIILLSACVGLAGQAGAVPAPRPPISSLLQTVQDGHEKRDVWHSPQSSLKNFPLLGEADCVRYGRKNGYPECLDGQPERPAEDTPEPQASEKAELAPPPGPLQVPLPVRRARALGDMAVPPLLRSAATIPTASPAVAIPSDDPLARTVGALLVVGFEGRSAADDGPRRVANALRQGRIGGVLLRRANITSAEQLRALTAFLSRGQERAPLILIEHSGGPDDALARAAGFQPVASPREVGAQGGALEAFNIYQQMAQDLSAAGVSLNVGPSAAACPQDASAATLDCFGSDPLHSAAFATAFTLAHQSRGVLTAMRYRVAAEDEGAAFTEMAKRKAPDVLIVSPAPGTKTLRAAGFSGAVLLDGLDSQDAAEKLVGALNRDADMVMFRTASGLEAGLSDEVLAGVRSEIDAGGLAQARLDDAFTRAAGLREQLPASRSRVVSGSQSNTAR